MSARPIPFKIEGICTAKVCFLSSPICLVTVCPCTLPVLLQARTARRTIFPSFPTCPLPGQRHVTKNLLLVFLCLLCNVTEETGQRPGALEVAGCLRLLLAVLMVNMVYVVLLDGSGAIRSVLLRWETAQNHVQTRQGSFEVKLLDGSSAFCAFLTFPFSISISPTGCLSIGVWVVCWCIQACARAMKHKLLPALPRMPPAPRRCGSTHRCSGTCSNPPGRCQGHPEEGGHSTPPAQQHASESGSRILVSLK